MKRELAVITVYVSLVFLLILSFAGALLESAAIQTAKNQAKAKTEMALESAFAEYDLKLQEKYHIFAVNCARFGGSDPEKALLERVRYYNTDTDGASVGKVQYLTDGQGEALYEQAVLYMTGRNLGGSAAALIRETEIFKQTEQEQESAGQTVIDHIREFADDLAETEAEAPSAGLFSLFTGIMGGAALDLVMPEGQVPSVSVIELSKTASHRQLHTGHGSFAQQTAVPAVAGSVFDAYLMDVMNKETDDVKESGLSYEIEYILSGKSSDRENLEETVGRLLVVRTALNAQYLKTDAAKQAQIAELAAFLSAILAAPESEPAIQEALTYVWSYGEALMDVRALLDKKKVPLEKDEASWTLSIGGLLNFARNREEERESTDSEEGLSYEEYLRILLALESRNTKCMRALDIMEVNLSQDSGGPFRADMAVCRSQIDSACALPRSVCYRFATQFGYR